MNDSRFVAACVGDGGCGEVGEMAAGGERGGNVGGGCSRVVVVGDDSMEEDVEKYAEVGVTIDGGEPSCVVESVVFAPAGWLV